MLFCPLVSQRQFSSNGGQWQFFFLFFQNHGFTYPLSDSHEQKAGGSIPGFSTLHFHVSLSKIVNSNCPQCISGVYVCVYGRTLWTAGNTHTCASAPQCTSSPWTACAHVTHIGKWKSIRLPRKMTTSVISANDEKQHMFMFNRKKRKKTLWQM